MKRRSESAFQAALIADFEACNAMILIIDPKQRMNRAGGKRSVKGWPDLQIYHRRFSFHLELKRLRGRLRPEQRIVLRRLWDRRFPAFILEDCSDDRVNVRTWDERLVEVIDLSGEVSPAKRGLALVDIFRAIWQELLAEEK